MKINMDKYKTSRQYIGRLIFMKSRVIFLWVIFSPRHCFVFVAF